MTKTTEMKLVCREVKKTSKEEESPEFEFVFKGIGNSAGAKLTLQSSSVDDYHIDDIIAVEMNTMVVPKQLKLGI